MLPHALLWFERSSASWLVDDLSNIHPREKRPVADRLASLALANAYKVFPTSGSPMVESIEWKGDKVVIHFRHVGKGLKSLDGNSLEYFELAGADGAFAPASAEITSPGSVVVYSPNVTRPSKLRFAWDETAQPNLGDAGGWPAFPFRSDGPEWKPAVGNE